MRSTGEADVLAPFGADSATSSAVNREPFGANGLTGFQSRHLSINDALSVGDTKDIGFFLSAKDSWARDRLHV
jgi:hypothetical protein